MEDIKPVSREQYAEYLSELFKRASEASPFDFLCSLLRVSGLQDADWDPFEELKEAFKDYNWHLNATDEALSEKSSWRIGLLMYCQAIEMTAPQELLANLIRCLKKDQYHLRPFGHLGRTNKKKMFSWVPPSSKAKFNALKKWASEENENKLIEYIDSFFNDNIRNSFSHSDYIITEDHYRWTESGLAQQIKLDNLNVLVTNCFNFYGALLWLHTQWLKDLASAPRFHKWPNFEVLELLSSDSCLYGFHVHFSNGSKATYSRTEEGTECCNITLESDGTIEWH